MKSLDPNEFNSRQMSVLYRLADSSFFGKLTTEKWMKMTTCSKTVAFRDIQHLVRKGFLISSDESGRNRGYYFNPKVVDRDE
jgi:Fic family protein